MSKQELEQTPVTQPAENAESVVLPETEEGGNDASTPPKKRKTLKKS